MTSASYKNRTALFPLNTVLFPGCQLPLQIFEQRYIRLVKESLRDETGFVIVLISEGNEVGASPEIFSTGNYVTITDWESLDNGLLGITVTAQRRVYIDMANAQHDGLLTATAHELPEHKTDHTLLKDYADLTDILKQLQDHPLYKGTQVNFEDSIDINNKLSYLLPVSNLHKQSLLEIDSPREHSEHLRTLIMQLQSDA